MCITARQPPERTGVNRKLNWGLRRFELYGRPNERVKDMLKNIGLALASESPYI